MSADATVSQGIWERGSWSPNQVRVTAAKGPFPFLRDPHNASLEGEGMPALFSASVQRTLEARELPTCPPTCLWVSCGHGMKVGSSSGWA